MYLPASRTNNNGMPYVFTFFVAVHGTPRQKVHILTSKKREGEICLILALSDLKTPLSQEKKGSSQPLILSSIFHNQSKQTVSGPFFVCLTTVTSQLKCS